MPTLGKLLGMPEDRRTYDTDTPLLVLRKCRTGLEFEAENVRSPLPLEVEEAGFWEQKADGSLRGQGMEYVLREPLFGNDLVKAVRWYCDWASEQRLESNYRTGFHVHVDCRNLDAAQLITMVVLYAVYEPVIYDWVGDDREGSIFCMPFYKAEGVLQEIVSAITAGERIRSHAEAIDRYAGFNLNALSRFGTVEWRHMQTTFNFDRVMKWINLCQSFKKYAKNNPLKSQDLLALLSNEGTDRLFKEVVGKQMADEMWRWDSNHKIWRLGVATAQEIATLLDGDKGLTWNSVRQTIGQGCSTRWKKWEEKEKAKGTFNKFPENPFASPELLLDRAFQQEAIDMFSAALRDAMNDYTPDQNPAR